MEPLNKAERNGSLLSFIAVYIIVLILPTFLAFWLGRTYAKGGPGNSKTVAAQNALKDRMEKLRLRIDEMATMDKEEKPTTYGPSMAANWANYLGNADQKNAVFRNEIEGLRNDRKFTSLATLHQMRLSACAYLDREHTERSINLANLRVMQGAKNEAGRIQQLESEKQQLGMQNQNLQNQLNMAMAQQKQQAAQMAATAAAGGGAGGGGGGGGKPSPEVENLKWQIKYCEANCTKAKADMLEAYNESQKRKQLYTVAKQNFLVINQKARSNYALQQLVTERLQDIDKSLSRL